jgi:hypothetical protein
LEIGKRSERNDTPEPRNQNILSDPILRTSLRTQRSVGFTIPYPPWERPVKAVAVIVQRRNEVSNSEIMNELIRFLRGIIENITYTHGESPVPVLRLLGHPPKSDIS